MAVRDEFAPCVVDKRRDVRATERLTILAHHKRATNAVATVAERNCIVERSKTRVPANQLTGHAQLPVSPACLEWQAADDERKFDACHDGGPNLALRAALCCGNGDDLEVAATELLFCSTENERTSDRWANNPFQAFSPPVVEHVPEDLNDMAKVHKMNIEYTLGLVGKAVHDHIVGPDVRLFLIDLEQAVVDSVATGTILVQVHPVTSHRHDTMAYLAV